MHMTIETSAVPSSTPSLHEDDHEQVVIRQDPESGLRFIVAVHSTALGPALGGMRLRRYPAACARRSTTCSRCRAR